MDVTAAATTATGYRDQLRTCRSVSAAEQVRCYLDLILGPGGLQSAIDLKQFRRHTITSALADAQGSCAALVAAVMALTEPLDAPFDALVLRDHVLLASRSERGIYYEVLDRGREVRENELRRFEPHPPGGPLRLSGREYLPYYLDNLAARLSDAAQPEAADRAFRSALELAPRAPRIRYNYGTFLLEARNPAAGFEQLDRAIASGWKEADAFVNRGVANWKLGRIEAARRDFGRALKLEPGNRRAAKNLSDLDAAAD